MDFEKNTPRNVAINPAIIAVIIDVLTARENSLFLSDVNSLERTEAVPTVRAMPTIIKTKYNWNASPYAAWTSLPNLPAMYTSVIPIKNSKNMIRVIGQLTDQLSKITSLVFLSCGCHETILSSTNLKLAFLLHLLPFYRRRIRLFSPKRAFFPALFRGRRSTFASFIVL